MVGAGVTDFKVALSNVQCVETVTAPCEEVASLWFPRTVKEKFFILEETQRRFNSLQVHSV